MKLFNFDIVYLLPIFFFWICLIILFIREKRNKFKRKIQLMVLISLDLIVLLGSLCYLYWAFAISVLGEYLMGNIENEYLLQSGEATYINYFYFFGLSITLALGGNAIFLINRLTQINNIKS